MSITGMSEQWVAARIKSLKDAILTHPDVRKRLDVFALSIYGLIVFPKALGHVDEAVTNLFDWLDKRVTLIPAILAETFKSLSACRKAGEGRFIGLATLRRDDISEEKWMVILQNLQEEDVEWRAHWLLPDEILYRCAVGYAPLLVLRQYRSRQFIPATQGIVDCEFSYRDDGYRKNIQEMSSAWKQTRRMKRLVVGPMTTPDYNEWWIRIINENIPKISQENSQSIEEYLRVVPSELEIIRQYFERRNADLEKQIEQMEEEKMNLRLDIDVQKLEIEKLRKGKNKAEEELDSLKADYKKLHLLEQFQKEMQDQLQQQMKEQLEKIQQKMMDKMVESQGNMMTKLTQLLTEGVDKGKGSVLNVEIGDSERPIYPPGFTPQHVEVYPRKSSATIKSQQFQAGVATPINFQARSGSNPGDNLVNPAIPDFDETAEKEKMKDGLPK
ncbi:hypothetical protein V6Z11_D10G170300 [Gossypium hirsutum]